MEIWGGFVNDGFSLLWLSCLVTLVGITIIHYTCSIKNH
jgi:hypothetical protein